MTNAATRIRRTSIVVATGVLVAAWTLWGHPPLDPDPAAAAAHGERNLRWFGYNEAWLERPGKVRVAADGGANVLRSVLSWRLVERRQGRYRWQPYDALYHRMLENGIKPLWVLSDAPCWARAETKRTCRKQGKLAHPPDPAHDWDWTGFVARVASRYPETVAIESWNEPNLAAFFKPAPDPARAARLTAWANFGVDRVDPSIPVLFGGVAPSFETIPGKEIAYQPFLRDAYRELGRGHWDGLAMHPFPSMRKQGHYLRDIHAHLNNVKRIMRDAGAPKTPLWVTEVGLSTRGIRPYTAKQQATGLRRIHRGLQRRDDLVIPAIIVHRLVDQRPGVGAPVESGWGVLRRNGRLKAAFCALAGERGRRCRGRR